MKNGTRRGGGRPAASGRSRLLARIQDPQGVLGTHKDNESHGTAYNFRRGEHGPDDDFDYDDVVEQSFPASDPPPPKG